MGRPHKKRNVAYNPNVSYFKPRGIPMKELSESVLTVDECEAIRLADYEGLSHEAAGELMGVSRATFGRIIEQARKVVADALINGRAIRIEGGSYRFVDTERRFGCKICNHQWVLPCGTGRPDHCPECGDIAVGRVRPAGNEPSECR
ncbi:MAG: DUF134 domain-containing protein [Desulfosalsimonas sp.]|uniref:DUF134 domain-containing protein n=1 Tax=Desulfosalsimonas sp. TaxID=3073848 RepID=UPI0039705745